MIQVANPTQTIPYHQCIFFMKAKASEPRGVPFFESSDKSVPSDQVTTDSKNSEKQKMIGATIYKPSTPSPHSKGEGKNYFIHPASAVLESKRSLIQRC